MEKELVSTKTSIELELTRNRKLSEQLKQPKKKSSVVGMSKNGVIGKLPLGFKWNKLKKIPRQPSQRTCKPQYFLS